MATDAAVSMGLKVEYGNNIHKILSQRQGRNKKIMQALSDGGKVTMEYRICFGEHTLEVVQIECGVNWMFNCTENQSNVK